MKKILITGVTGQDGSLMADFLLKNTDNLIIGGIRRLSVENHINIQHLKNNPRFKLIDLDITDCHNIDRVICEEKPDYFINFAANSFVGTSWKMPYNHLQTNTAAVIHQLEAIKKHCPLCRYYNAGSSEEFGDVVYSPQDLSHPIRPRSPYGAAKAAARFFIKVYRESFGLYAIQGFLFNHEGTRRGTEFVTRKITKNVARIAKSVICGVKAAPLELGNIDSLRDWSDAEDFVEGVWLMLNQVVPNGKLPKEYILSSNETHSIREFVELAFTHAGLSGCKWEGSGLNEKYIHPDFGTLVIINPEFYRPAEVELLLGDSSEARNELGWLPKTSFEDLVKKMVDADMVLV